MELSYLKVGESAIIKSIRTEGSMRRRLLDLGLVEGTSVKCMHKSPAGDPKAYLIRGAVIALRKEDSETIDIISWDVKGELDE